VPSTLPALLFTSAEKHPHRPLFIHRGHELTYESAVQQCRAFGRALRELGVLEGDRVALVINNRPEYPLAYYGALCAGATIVPLCPDTRRGTLLRALRHCEARAVVIEPRNTKLLEACQSELPELRAVISVGAPAKVDLGDAMPHLNIQTLLEGPDGPPSTVSSESLAAIMYTSGTTAQPKGVMLAHRNLLANTRSTVEYLHLNADERLALVLPLFYSYGNSLLHTHIAAGGTLVDVGTVAFPAAVLRGIAQARCTGLSGVPSTFARLVHSKVMGEFDLSSLRYLTQAGGPMTPALTERVLAAFQNAELFVMYGQTEAAPRLTFLAPADLSRKLGSVGKAIPDVTLEVLDAAGKPVDVGAEGELVARGDNIMLGYFKDPEATARALRPEGLRTGDLARVDDEGFITIIGRSSDMIKAGAHRIGPKEIEAVIEKLDGITECAVVGVPDELLGEAIAAFIVRTDGKGPSEKEIMRFCHEHLPRFKLPAHLVFVDTLPRTNTGKLRRSSLKSWQPETKS